MTEATREITMLALTPSGELREVTATGSRGALAAMYEAMRCDEVERVQLPEELDMWLDVEGLLKREPEINLYAMAVARAVTGMSLAQPLVGTVVFAGRSRTATVSIDAAARVLITELVGFLAAR